jgi:hypothetical protein
VADVEGHQLLQLGDLLWNLVDTVIVGDDDNKVGKGA